MISDHTAILMGTFNGGRFLSAQVNSILQQSAKSWTLWVSDDGSVDETLCILLEYQATLGADRLHILEGPQQGFVCNFLSLICNPAIRADYFAYADQDDIWLPDKLERAIAVLNSYPRHLPALYCSRTLIIDEGGVERGRTLLDRALPSFGNALIQNIASGNTMVFNAGARDLLMEAGQTVNVFAHDWWAYLAVMATGGLVIFDPIPRVKYRQHGSNLVGASIKLPALLRRTRLDRNGHLRSTLRENIAALDRIRYRMTPDNLRLLDKVNQLWHPNPVRRTSAFFCLPFKRQRFLGNCSLGLAVMLGRV